LSIGLESGGPVGTTSETPRLLMEHDLYPKTVSTPGQAFSEFCSSRLLKKSIHAVFGV